MTKSRGDGAIPDQLASGSDGRYPTNGMTFNEYQQVARRTTNPALTEDDRLVDAAAGLAEEASEVLAHVRKHRFQQRPLDRAALIEELGDALWCLAAVASSQGIALDEIAAENIAKITRRHPDLMP